MSDRMRVIDERPRVSNALDAERLIETVMETLSALSHVVGEETGLIKAGRLKDAMEREARKAELVAEVRADLDAALPGIRALDPGAGRAVALAHGLFAALVDRIEATPAAELAHRRIRVPDRQKARIAARVLARGRRGGRR